MKVTGVIAEYNPFHNGHALHLDRVKELTNADYIVVVMSGDFTQRGAPALMDKYLRTRMALTAGADLVIELPLYYAAGSAEYFASGAIALLDKIGVVDSLCFGSECGDINLLTDIATILANETPEFSKNIKQKIRLGATYPQARMRTIEEMIPNSFMHVSAMSFPNNTLGFEYIRSLIKRQSKIVPYTNKRMGSDYHDRMMMDTLSSALSIRQSLESLDSLDMVQSQIPHFVYDLMKENYHRTLPVFCGDISAMLKYKLLLDAPNGYTEYVDISKQFSAKIIKNLNNYTTFSSFCDILKSKDITYTRVSRCLLHILLNIRKDNLERYIANDYISYARLLGFRESAAPLLKELKQQSRVPLISKLADARNILSPDAMEMLENDIQAAHIYDTIVTSKFGAATISEFSREIIKL